MKNKLFSVWIILSFFIFSFKAWGHDTTHVHPLITLNIAKLIQEIDKGDGKDNAYSEIYKLLPEPVNIAIIPEEDQFLYWGTDFDPVELSGKSDAEKKIILLESDPQLVRYERNNNVIDGVVFEDRPSNPFNQYVLGGLPDKVRHHFYQGNSGDALSINQGLTPAGEPSSIRAMGFFNQAVEMMSGYTEESKQEAFFIFGQALHHVEDMKVPAHIHNDPENALFAPVRRYGQLKNTHVVASTLRFLNSPCLALKQTELFQKDEGRFVL